MAKKTEAAVEKQPQGSAMKAAEDSIRKKFGIGASFYLNTYEEKKPLVIPTGCLGLDYALGTGGMVAGKMVEIFGMPSTGKTSLSISIAANGLRVSDKKILYVDAEHALNRGLTKSFNLDENRTVVLSLPTAEQNLEAAEIFIKTGEFVAVIVDSVAALTPAAQYEATLSDQFMGLHARLMSRMCSTIKTACSMSGTLLLLINQIRFKIGGYGDPSTTTGGNAIPFYADVRVKVSGGEGKNSRILNADGKVIGHRNTFNVVKNKLAPPFADAEVDLIFGKGYDTVGELVTLGEEMGFIETGGAWMHYKDHKFQGREKTKEGILSNPELLESLKSDINKVLGK